MCKKSVSLFLFCVLALRICTAQTPEAAFNAALSKLKPSLHTSLLLAFYALNGSQLVWLAHSDRLRFLFSMLHRSKDLALNERDYQYGLVSRLEAGVNAVSFNSDSLQTDILLSDAALHFCSDLKTGNAKPALGYAGLRYQPTTEDVPALLYRGIAGGGLNDLFASLEPSDIVYRHMMQKLRVFNRIMSMPDYKEVRIDNNKVSAANLALLTKLFQLGIIASIDTSLSQEALLQYLKSAQHMVDVLEDGQLRSTALAELNVSLARRWKELALAINYLRWLNQIRLNNFVALVNLPSAALYVYNGGVLQLDSKVIVGKPATPSPTLSSTITEVVLYPYWMVPNKIAVKELLPAIRRNIGYLDLGGFQVISKLTGRVVNPYTVNWNSLGPGNFPYVIRQSTGCDNSLGLLKFNFESPFSVYLHDTPSKSLFLINKRYFSHGCIRVEKPFDLAHLVVVQNRKKVDAVTQKGCLKNQSPMPVQADRPLALMIIYSTAWYSANGEVRFYDDIYHKLPGLLAADNVMLQYLVANAVTHL